ncbi:MAG TPA: GTP 3',8-cyclase MoaA [Bacteroidia bacterium]|nr:GTP 3',8-cyclase MoaA [Bacteroidia bacterium]HNS12434.1 GTP 3',8-cyclase MoaA [Bacteroidia bacterium]
MLIDEFQRVHDYLRISLIDNCNLRCNYCMPLNKTDFSPPQNLMQADEILQIAKIFVQLGISKIRLTGGEPLIRKDVDLIIRNLSALPIELTLSSNGILVDRYIDLFEQAGIRSLNISLDSLDSEKFKRITHQNYFERVFSNIQLLLERKFHVKLNVVVMRGVNDDEIIDFVQLTKLWPLHVRFIEFMPFSGNNWKTDQVFSHAEILQKLESEFDIVKLVDGKHDTTKKFKVIGHQGTFALISTMTQPFCSGCNRLRLTADGKMKNCLFSKGETDILSILRRGEDIIPSIRANVLSKKAERGGQIMALSKLRYPENIENRSMVSIGG